ncbi:MAG: DUF4236 domain-containing protein [Janthinobacterium lividum]
MSFRFRKAVRLFPGVRLNLSKSGMSVSVGGPGATVNFSRRGQTVTLGLPGTGLSYSQHFPHRRQARPSGQRDVDTGAALPRPEESLPTPLPPAMSGLSSIPGEIRSSEVAGLTTPDLQGLKQLLNEAAAQKKSLAPDLAEALASRGQVWRSMRRREQFPLRLLLKRGIPKARAAFEQAEVEALKVIEAIALSEVRVVFGFDGASLDAQRELVQAHSTLSRAHRVWDVLSSTWINQAKERSAASSVIRRTPVALSTVKDGVVAGDQTGLRFQNANGADLDFFPGFLLMRDRGAADYALIDIRDVRIDAQPVRFIEEEAVPGDATVVDYAWAKSNRDGSPDRRFRDNKQIPVVQYGALHFSTATGLEEAYHVSDCEKALAFGSAFHRLQTALREMASRPVSEHAVPALNAEPTDVASQLPALPDIGGAHEYTVLAVFAAAVVAAFVVYARGTPNPETSIAPPIAAVAATPLTPPAAPSAQAERDAFISRALNATPSLPATGSPAVGTLRERLQTLQAVNVRAAPDKGAAVSRVLPAGMAIDVFGRDGQWVRVGQGQPWGWTSASLLRPQR